MYLNSIELLHLLHLHLLLLLLKLNLYLLLHYVLLLVKVFADLFEIGSLVFLFLIQLAVQNDLFFMVAGIRLFPTDVFLLLLVSNNLGYSTLVKEF